MSIALQNATSASARAQPRNQQLALLGSLAQRGGEAMPNRPEAKLLERLMSGARKNRLVYLVTSC
jgi:hypothetical protein